MDSPDATPLYVAPVQVPPADSTNAVIALSPAPIEVLPPRSDSPSTATDPNAPAHPSGYPDATDALYSPYPSTSPEASANGENVAPFPYTAFAAAAPANAPVTEQTFTPFPPINVPAASAVAPAASRSRVPRDTAWLARLGAIGVSVLGGVLLALWGYVFPRLIADSALYGFLTLEGLSFWLPGLGFALLTGLLVWLVAGRRASPGLPPITAGVFPVCTMIAGLLVLSVYHDRAWWFAIPIATGAALITGTVARTFLRDPSGAGHDIARTALTIISYVVAFIALAMVYINKLRSVQSATAVTILCILLLLQMSDGEAVPVARRLVYAVAGGLIVGQVTWIINYWSATGWTGGAFLLAVFYLVAGLSAAHLRDRIGLFDIVEFGGVALLALAIVSAAVLYQS